MTNAKSVSLDFETAALFLKEAESLRERLDVLKERIILAMPAKKGSKLWWQKETIVGLKQLEEGKGYEAKNLKDALKYLHS